jgi:hypothetical protein
MIAAVWWKMTIQNLKCSSAHARHPSSSVLEKRKIYMIEWIQCDDNFTNFKSSQTILNWWYSQKIQNGVFKQNLPGNQRCHANPKWESIAMCPRNIQFFEGSVPYSINTPNSTFLAIRSASTIARSALYKSINMQVSKQFAKSESIQWIQQSKGHWII